MNLITSARNLNCKQVCFFKFCVYAEFHYEVKIKRDCVGDCIAHFLRSPHGSKED